MEVSDYEGCKYDRSLQKYIDRMRALELDLEDVQREKRTALLHSGNVTRSSRKEKCSFSGGRVKMTKKQKEPSLIRRKDKDSKGNELNGRDMAIELAIGKFNSWSSVESG
eukprot:TRINITY_DN13593_c0_g1_i3.p1 TRINITY_DN13593_c0_g1~~TRINITY_DN13593_c0_g1_i3.p1  ORF type:complete len:110 (-),score=12.38 TRINITY_DN13593_c0_g1_i3:237-566(-)